MTSTQPRCLFGAVAFVLNAGFVWAGPFDYSKMPAGVFPRIDGAVTSADEWVSATHKDNSMKVGTYHAEYQRDWQATSASADTATYAGVTAFILHDLWAYETSELADYNTFTFGFGGQTLTAWIFAGGDEANDATWINNSGLGVAAIDDRGFVVRLNNDPTTDKHWLPGDAEPGDAAWAWGDYYGLFGKAGFNDSAFASGLQKSRAGLKPNEVYEVAFYGGAPGAPVTGIFPVIIPSTVTITQTISDPKNGQPSQSQVILIDGPAHIPEPAPIALLAVPLVVKGLRVIRQRLVKAA